MCSRLSLETEGESYSRCNPSELVSKQAIAYGYSNIFVTAPSPENLGTVFEFILKARR